MNKISLNKIKEIKIENGVTKITYEDNVTHIVNGDIHIVKDLNNEKLDGPIVDHCI